MHIRSSLYKGADDGGVVASHNSQMQWGAAALVPSVSICSSVQQGSYDGGVTAKGSCDVKGREARHGPRMHICTRIQTINHHL